MNSRNRSVWAVVCFGITTILFVIAFVTQVLVGGFLSLTTLILVTGYTFSIVGVLIALRRPDNRVAWICLVVGALLGVEGAAWGVALYGMANPGVIAAPEWFAGVGDAAVMPGVFMVGTFLFLLFPDGRLPSPRWAPLGWLAGAWIICAFLISVFDPGTTSWGRPPFEKPWLPSSAVSNETVLTSIPATVAIMILLVGSVGGSVVALIVKYRRSKGQQRQQMKWFAFAASTLMILFVPSVFIADRVEQIGLVMGFFFIVIPMSIGIAILRHGLFDIDRLISRTVAYGFVIVTIGLVYAGVAIWIPQVMRFSDESPLLVAVATLAAAALFNPWRKRVLKWVDRRFYRSRYDAQLEMEAFSDRVRTGLSANVDDLVSETLQVVSNTVAPTAAGIWIRDKDRPRGI